MIATVLAFAALLAPAPAGAGAARPAVSLTASPVRVSLTAGAVATVELTNAGTQAVDVTASPAALALDLRGRPSARVHAPRSAATWLVSRPRLVRVEPGRRARVQVVATVPPRAEPGDHHAVLLLAARPVRRAGVAIRIRVGVRVVVRAPGTVVRRLQIGRLRVRRGREPRALEVELVNRGNVTEELPRGRVMISLLRHGRLVARLTPSRRELLPRTRGVVRVAYAPRLRGAAVALVEVRGGPRRAFAVRL